jgi:hypothetical protein
MSRNIQLELPDDQAKILELVAAGLHKTPSEAIALFMEEGLRREMFPQVDFRDSSEGRQAYASGSSLAVWEVVMIAESYGMDPALSAAHLKWTVSRVETLLAYARAYPQEIAQALSENRSVSSEDIRRMLPDALFAEPV